MSRHGRRRTPAEKLEWSEKQIQVAREELKNINLAIIVTVDESELTGLRALQDAREILITAEEAAIVKANEDAELERRTQTVLQRAAIRADGFMHFSDYLTVRKALGGKDAS